MIPSLCLAPAGAVILLDAELSLLLDALQPGGNYYPAVIRNPKFSKVKYISAVPSLQYSSLTFSPFA